MPMDKADSRSIADLARVVGRYAWIGLGLCLLAAVGSTLWLAGPKVFSAWHQFPLWLFPVLGGMLCLACSCAATRIYLLARSLGHAIAWRQALATLLSLEFGVMTSPGGAGGTAIRFALLRRLGVPLSTATAMFAAEGLTDALFFLGLAPLAVYVLYADPVWREMMVGFLPALRILGWALVGVLTLGLVLMRCRRVLGRVLHRRVSRIRGKKHWRLPARLRWGRASLAKSGREAWRAGRLLMRRRRGTLVATMVLATTQWLCRYGVLPTILMALGASRNPLPLILLQAFLFALALASALPGGGGTMEIMGTMVLTQFVARDDAVVAMLVWRLFTYHLVVLAGGIALSLVFRNGWRRKETSSGCPETA